MYTFMAYVKNPKDLRTLQSLLQEISWRQAWRYYLFTRWESLMGHARKHPKDVQAILIDGDRDVRPSLQKAWAILGLEPNARILFSGPKETNVQKLYEVDHLYFLERPFEKKSLISAMEKTARSLGKGLQELLHVVNQKGIHSFSKDQITFLEKDLRMIHVHTGEGSCSFYGRFSELEPYLDGRFCQCHQSYIVNLYQVRDLQQEAFTLKTGEKIPISKQRRHLVRRHYEKFIEARPWWQRQKPEKEK